MSNGSKKKAQKKARKVVGTTTSARRALEDQMQKFGCAYRAETTAQLASMIATTPPGEAMVVAEVTYPGGSAVFVGYHPYDKAKMLANSLRRKRKVQCYRSQVIFGSKDVF